MDRQQPDYVAVGIVERARGLRGQVKVKPLTDEPARFERLREVRVELVSGEARRLHIRAVTILGASVYLRFDEIDNKDEADGLAGAYINIRYDEILPVENNTFYHFEVIGFEVVTSKGEFVGTVQKVMDLPANDVLMILGKGREYLVPVVKDVIKKVDRNNAQIVIEPIEGLLD